MFEIKWTDREDMETATQECFQDIQGIDEIIRLQNTLFKSNDHMVCFGDAQIDGLEYPPNHDRLTVYICYNDDDNYEIHYVIDFFNPEIEYFDIEFNTHWIDDVTIQKNADGKYSISFGSGECDFRYSSAKVNRCWIRSGHRNYANAEEYLKSLGKS